MLLDRFKSALARIKGTKAAYHQVFGTSEGQIVLRDLLTRSGVLNVSMVAGDGNMTHYNEGRRSIGLEIMSQMRWSEGELMQLAMQRTADHLATMTENEGG